jgi:hypothetical protein
MAQLSPFQSFLAGREARQQQDYADTRNALARAQLDAMPEERAQRNALAATQLEGAQLQNQVTEQGWNANKAKIAYTQLQQALSSGNPRQFITQQIPLLAAKLKENGVDLETLDDEAAKKLTSDLAKKFAGDAGIAPAAQLETLQINGGGILQRDPMTGTLKQVVAPQKQSQSGFTIGPGESRYDENGKLVARMPPKPDKAVASFTALTPDELKAAGLPEGTTAQKNNETGEIKVVNRPGTSEVKARVIEQQNKRAYDVYSTGISGLKKGLEGASTGPVVGRLPAMTAGQQIAESSVAAMAPILKQMFRSAGEGAFTDQDQKLLLDMIPTRSMLPEARQAALANIDAIVRAKLGMPAATTESPTQEPRRVRSIQEARALPPGTEFITPDGRHLRVPNGR